MQRNEIKYNLNLLIRKYVGIKNSNYYFISIVADLTNIGSSGSDTSVSDCIEKKTKSVGNALTLSMSKVPCISIY